MNRLFLLLIPLLVSCQKEKSLNGFSDEIILRIADMKDRRLPDSLYRYFEHDHSPYRREAVLAFGSIQDSMAVEKIRQLLINDPDPSVRKAAAFALGQTVSEKSATALRGAARNENDPDVLNEILEAYGKVSLTWMTLIPTSEAPSAGTAWSLYRAGLRNAVTEKENNLAAALLDQKNTDDTRLAASHFLARGAMNTGPRLQEISQAALSDPNVNVRMAAAYALRKISTDSAITVIAKILESPDDYRVRINALRALQGHPYEKTKDLLLAALGDDNVNVGIAASEVIRDNATERHWIDLANRVSEIKNPRIQANLYQAILSAKDIESITDEVKESYRQSTDPYQRAGLLSVLQDFEFIHAELINTDTPVVRSAAASALVAIDRQANFPSTRKPRFADLYRQAFETGDPAVIGIIASALADSSLGYRAVIKDISFLYDARKRLALPRENEALQPLQAAIALFEGHQAPVVANEFNHPIDWQLVRSISRNARATIKTSRGHIVMRLFVEEAPGSVANFVSLARRDYFDGKFFHRVVPNFVIQAGCNRGDGWGSEDYSIRSEFSPRRYKTGSVGMASAGKDTEGTQWFITHSPTPHLDGRYTIFAEVETGMEVVHLIEVGDQILDVEIEGVEITADR